MQALSEVLALRVSIYQAIGKWEPMKEIAEQLCQRHPGELQWMLFKAIAVHRCDSLIQAYAVLREAEDRFPEKPAIHYNLACYAAQLGDLSSARRHLSQASV